MLDGSAYDVVIADVKMPEPSVFIAGDIDGQATRTFLERTRCGYFMKPFNLDHLTSAADLLVGLQREMEPGA